MNQIRLEWTRFPDSTLVAVEADGMGHAQLRHYAQRVGFVGLVDDEDNPVIIGTGAQRDGLRSILESAGYDIVEEAEVVS